MLSQVVVTGIVALVAIQRLAEFAYSRRNEQRLRARGAMEHAPWQVPMLATLHCVWLVSVVGEIWLMQPPFRPWIGIPAMIVFLTGQLIRVAAMRSLGDRWTVGVFTLSATPRVTRGLYSCLRHPNYVGVALELASLPLVHGSAVTALVFSVLNGIALSFRIDVESRALARAEP